MAKTHVTDQLPTAGQMKEFWSQWQFGSITRKRFQEFLEEKKSRPLPTETSHFRLIGEIAISATKAGKGMDRNNTHPFDWVDGNFDNWDAQTVSKDTGEATAYVYQQMQNGTYAEIFGSFNKDLDLLELETHEQIKDLVEKLSHPKDHATHFLYKSKNGKRFVAYVNRNPSCDLYVTVYEFSLEFVWAACNAHRIVVLAKTLEPKS